MPIVRSKNSLPSGYVREIWLGAPALVVGLALLCSLGAQAQTASVETGCNGAFTPSMLQVAKPYHRAVLVLKGSEAGWCTVAANMDDEERDDAMQWEFVSAAYLMHALQGRKQFSKAQLSAIQAVMQRVPGLNKLPTRLREIDYALYVHMRTMAANDFVLAQISLSRLEHASPKVYLTLARRSGRWGDADDD